MTTKSPTTKPTAARLAKALREKTLVKFTESFDVRIVDGYVLDIGPRFFLIATLNEGVSLDGYRCFRKSDVRGLKAPHPRAAFVEAVLKKRGERLLRKPNVNLSSIDVLLRSAGVAFPLVAIHREKVKPGSCRIGRVIDVTKEHVSLLEIDPNARWDNKPTQYRLSEITEVSFGSSYEDALHLVAGYPELR